MQTCTQRYDRRPYGVGLLVAGFDDLGPHIYQTCPSANYFDCKAMAIGARSQSARTYLEKHLDVLPSCTTEDLISHGLRALRDTLPAELQLTVKNVSIGLVGKSQPFSVLDEEQTGVHLSRIEGEERRSGGPGAAVGDAGGPPADDDDAGDRPDPVPAVAMETN